MMSDSQLDILFRRCMTGQSTDQENEECLALLSKRSNEEQARALMQQWLSAIDSAFPVEQSEESASVIFESIVNADRELEKNIHRVHFLRRGWFRYAAAILLLLTGIAVYYNFSHTQNKHTSPAVASVEVNVLPGYNRAVLTLSNGQQVELDSVASETIKDGALSIVNKNGQLIYRQGDVMAMNTMTTPMGGQYQLTLADGTKVWLNAASSITYPTSFTGKKREVSVTGEACFEVAKNAAQPFIVHTPKEVITVLGTQFNVNVYADEPVSKTSLVEGAVQINNSVLKPGYAYVNGKIVQTNIEQDVAWKNGVFNFDNMDLKAALRQISRWYNVEVKFEGEILPVKLKGRMGRDLTIAQVLEGFKGFGINIRLQDRTLIISGTR